MNTEQYKVIKEYLHVGYYNGEKIFVKPSILLDPIACKVVHDIIGNEQLTLVISK